MSKNSIVTSLLLATLAAGVSTAATDWRDFRGLAARTAISEEAAKPGSNCPLSKAYVNALDLDVLSLCVRYGWPAMDAAQRYPVLASKVFALYGENPTFRAVFDRYGHPVIPVVGYLSFSGRSESFVLYLSLVRCSVRSKSAFGSRYSKLQGAPASLAG